jgi:acetoacetyl-[acyl-carrier protein] synthase
VLSPEVVKKMLQKRYSSEQWKSWQGANEAVREQQQAYDDAMIAGTERPVYKFDHGVLDGSDVELGDKEMHIAGKAVNLDLESPFSDMRID